MLRQGAGKNNSRRCILMNKIIDFEKVGEQCRSSRPANALKVEVEEERR